MSIRFDLHHDFVVDGEICDGCGQPMYDTGCPSAHCSGWGCVGCGRGCAYGLVPDSACAQELAGESEQDRAERIDVERAAWGLGSVADLPPSSVDEGNPDR